VLDLFFDLHPPVHNVGRTVPLQEVRRHIFDNAHLLAPVSPLGTSKIITLRLSLSTLHISAMFLLVSVPIVFEFDPLS